jgi:hypothetical protein
MIPFRGQAEIAGRLDLAAAKRILLVEAPPELESIVLASGAEGQDVRSIEARAIRSVKDTADFILIWQESRVGSRAVFESALKRLEPGGRLWVVTALKKVSGPRTPAIHRLEVEDLRKAFAKSGLTLDREARLSAWHTGYRFVYST